MACDNVALVVSVNPNVRPRGGPTSSRIATPFFKDHNALNNNESLKENNGRRELDATELRFNRDNSTQLVGSTNVKNPSNENGRLRPAENNSPPSSSCNNVEKSPHRKIIAK